MLDFGYPKTKKDPKILKDFIKTESRQLIKDKEKKEKKDQS